MGRKIWIMNHYASRMFFEQGGRHYSFAKYLKRLRNEPIIFCCNSVHNGEGIHFQDKFLWNIHMAEEIQVPFVFVRGRPYRGNGIGRILNMIDFYRNVKIAAKEYAKEHGTPDVIYASSVHPLTLWAGIQLARFFQVKCICEIRDLWPEAFVLYGLISKHNPILLPMYLFEKKMYERADEIIFSMEGGYDYIKERGWERTVPLDKVHHINNGVDLEVFDANCKRFIIDDEDLQNTDIFKVVYTGSVRFVNHLEKLIEIAKATRNPKVKFLVWGKGAKLSDLRRQVSEEGVKNIVFKGYVDKKYVPYIISRSDLNIQHGLSLPAKRYGTSSNKIFDYMAAGKPILTDFPCKYNPVVQCNAGVEVIDPAIEIIVSAIETFAGMNQETYTQYCRNARKAAEKFDFKNLTEKLLEVLGV